MTATACAALAVVILGVACQPRFPATRQPPNTDPPNPALAATLDAVSTSIRSGTTVAAAVIDVTGGAANLAGLASDLRDGSALVDAIDRVPIVDADSALALHALRCAATLAAVPSAPIDAAAAVLRERACVRAERVAHSAQARLSARVLTLVPPGFAAWSLLTSSATRHAYVAVPATGVCVAAGLALNGVGWWWMRRLINR